MVIEDFILWVVPQSRMKSEFGGAIYNLKDLIVHCESSDWVWLLIESRVRDMWLDGWLVLCLVVWPALWMVWWLGQAGMDTRPGRHEVWSLALSCSCRLCPVPMVGQALPFLPFSSLVTYARASCSCNEGETGRIHGWTVACDWAGAVMPESQK